MKLSFIVPAYNVERWLEKTVRSILKEIKSADDGEIIIVNDCSTDGTLSCAQKLSLEAPGLIKVIHQEKNGGVSVARNVGLRAAEGEWIWFVDGDDEIVDGAVSCLKHAVAMFPDVDIITFKHFQKQIDDPLILPAQFGKKPIVRDDFNSNEDIDANVKCFARLYGWMLGWNSIQRRKILDGIEFEPGVKLGEDVVFCGRAIFSSKRTVALENQLYVYNVREGSAVHQVGIGWIRSCCACAELQARVFLPYSGNGVVRKVLVRKIKNLIFRLGVMNLGRVSKSERIEAMRLLLFAAEKSLVRSNLLSPVQKFLYHIACAGHHWHLFALFAYYPWLVRQQVAKVKFIREFYHKKF